MSCSLYKIVHVKKLYLYLLLCTEPVFIILIVNGNDINQLTHTLKCLNILQTVKCCCCCSSFLCSLVLENRKREIWRVFTSLFGPCSTKYINFSSHFPNLSLSQYIYSSFNWFFTVFFHLASVRQEQYISNQNIFHSISIINKNFLSYLCHFNVVFIKVTMQFFQIKRFKWVDIIT